VKPAEYDVLERAIQRGERVAVRLRGAELVIVPLKLAFSGGREIVETRHPTSGMPLKVDLAEVQSLEAVR
jgi:hypothetical protein